MTKAYIGVGSNIEPERNVAAAVQLLSARLMITGISTFYRTKAEAGKRQKDYYNGVIAVETELPPKELKYEVLRATEKRLGRKRTKDKFRSRTIDLDLLAYGGLRLRSRELTLPDPDIRRRPYLAAGIAELNGVLHPLAKYTESLREKIQKWNRIPQKSKG